MNWFENLIADLINLLAQGIQGLSGMGLGDVIIKSIFPDPGKAPNLGTGWFSDIMSTKTLASLGPMAYAFWALGWAFFGISIYFFAAQVASASNSAIQRERLKQGVVRIILAAVMMWEGPRFALLISQGFFYGTEYMLSASGSLSTAMTLNNNGGQALLNSTVNLFSSIMALIVWVIYEFRKIFLYAWMIFFPLAMAFYTNDKTRGITKMWWWEWTYQMAIPLGQSVVYGIAVAIAKPDSSATLTASDVFAALAGVIGLISSAVYVRKLMDTIAQNFGASLMGFNAGERLGQMAAMGAAFGLGDMGAKMGIKGASAALGKPMKGLFKKIDNLPGIRGAAENAVKNHPELYSQAIQAGAGIDDIMLHHQMGAFGDSLNAAGAGLEAAGAVGRGTLGGPNRSQQTRPAMKHSMITRLQTAGAIRDVGAGVKNTLSNSNMALIAKGKLHGLQSSGGVTGRVGQAVAFGVTATPGLKNISPIANSAHNYLARTEAKQQRLADMREHMRGVMETNAAAQRLPNINHLHDSDTQQFTGRSVAEQAYVGARQNLVSTVQQSMAVSQVEASSMVRDWQGGWDAGKHVSVSSFTPEVQSAYRQAFSLYQPAAMDARAKEVVITGRLTAKPVDPHHNMKHGTTALLNDARRAMVQGR